MVVANYRSFMQCFGATSMAVSVARNLRYNRPKWLVIGQEGGAFIRCQTTRLFSTQITNVKCFHISGFLL